MLSEEKCRPKSFSAVGLLAADRDVALLARLYWMSVWVERGVTRYTGWDYSYDN